MPLDATVGGSTANSYLTREEAIAYMATRLHTGAWDALSDDDKDKSLMMATRLIDRYVCFLGPSATATQALRFPITGLLELTGRVVADDEIPPAIKEATAELALLLATTDYTAPNEAAAQGLTQIKAGPVELRFKELIETNRIDGVIRPLVPAAWLCPTAEEVNKKAEFRLL